MFHSGDHAPSHPEASKIIRPTVYIPQANIIMSRYHKQVSETRCRSFDPKHDLTGTKITMKQQHNELSTKL